jgi:uncharacterized protein YndB with AHSA1/START domain
MLKKILLTALAVFVAILAVLAIVVAMQPSDFRIAREIVIDAPPAAVFEHVNDFHNWQAWSPWAKLDPQAKNTFEGAPEGEGAVFRWAGNSQVGEGSMTILESRPGELVKIRLDFLKPFEDTSTAQFAFQPTDDKTAVTWSMDGENNFIEKAFCLMVDMDAMLGSDFEKGLASLKAVVEDAPAAEEDSPSTDTDPQGE